VAMDAKKLLQLDEDELFTKLGSYLPKYRGISNKNLGKNWFNNKKKNIAEIICVKYEKLKNIEEIDAVIEIAALIGDAFIGIPALIIAVIIVKTGLSKLCN
jgi:hypothetical protein